MLTQAAVFLVSTLGELFALALLLRFLLQWLRVGARGPLAQFLAALTDWIVRPARRIVPGWWGLDLATLLLAWLTELLQLWLVLELGGHRLDSAGAAALAALALVQLARLAIYMAMAALVVQAVLSWINPYSPLAPLLDGVTRPLLRPFRRLIPLVANVDLSPLFALIACQLLLMLPVAWLELSLGRFLR
ncbi:MAG TPA: YggT family protein [Burkholderiales bacterium]|nr:YggT family protein [Burkholderiales bacterium]